VSYLEDRLRRLERKLVWQPSVDEYLDASNRERVRALHTLTQRLEKYGFDGGYLFTEGGRLMLATDTPEKRERDLETVDAWYRAQGRDHAAEVEGAREKLLAKLEARSKNQPQSRRAGGDTFRTYPRDGASRTRKRRG
jgi:hypothetical protein